MTCPDPAAPPRPLHTAPGAPAERHAPEPPEDSPAGPGWYESSWDLRQGLEVCEAPWHEAMAVWAQAA